MNLFKLAAGALLASTLAFVPVINIKFETLPSDLNSGMTCDLGTANYMGMTLIEFEPKIGGFSFGTSGLTRVPYGSQEIQSFESYDVDHYVYPRINLGVTWDQYVLSPVGSNDAGYFSI